MVITILYICSIKYKYNEMHKDLATKMFITAVFFIKQQKIKSLDS